MARHVDPKHFYLNEQHELSRTEREGGGRLPKLGAINWASKQRTLSASLKRTREALDRSTDPLKGQRYFLLAKPERTIPKLTENKRKAPSGRFDEAVDYGGKDSRVLGRLGLDVLSVTDAGAVVHATPEQFNRLTAMAPNLADLGRVEQSRWAFVAEFDPVPAESRADRSWLTTIGHTGRHEALIELQPLLTRAETAVVLRLISEKLHRADGEAILGSGTDFSGRSWFRARLTAKAILEIVKNYFSVQAVHPPFLSAIAAGRPRSAPGRSVPHTMTTQEIESLPVIGVVDSGVAEHHPILARYRRGTFRHPGSAGVFDDHGTFVTSRVVFGDPSDPLNNPPGADYRFVDVVVAKDRRSVEDKIIVNAIETSSAVFPDVRTFNLSFGDYTAIGLHQNVERTERLFLTQDLDNLIFARDLLVVVAAGNSVPGLIPNAAYPGQWQDPAWGVGNWAAGFNTLKCGSFVNDQTIAGGLASVPGTPSPFSKCGPGMAEAPVPDFSAHGGNCDASYRSAAMLGVQGLTPAGLWEDRAGTSYSAPLLARECARAVRLLQQVCPAGTQPFASTVKALLALTARSAQLDSQYDELALRTLGFGVASCDTLGNPSVNEAILVWQGVLADKTDVARVLVPIPKDWLAAAPDPVCDVAVSWDTPVNAAAPNTYGCRRVDLKLRPTPDADAVRPSRGEHRTYPLRRRLYGLKRAFERKHATDDLWLLELSYEEMCDYPPTQTFTPEQRVSVALRLFDRANKVSPQQAVQEHPMSATMTRLSVTPLPVTVAITVKTM